MFPSLTNTTGICINTIITISSGQTFPFLMTDSRDFTGPLLFLTYFTVSVLVPSRRLNRTCYQFLSTHDCHEHSLSSCTLFCHEKHDQQLPTSSVSTFVLFYMVRDSYARLINHQTRLAIDHMRELAENLHSPVLLMQLVYTSNSATDTANCCSRLQFCDMHHDVHVQSLVSASDIASAGCS